jgi:hypothetical protein
MHRDDARSKMISYATASSQLFLKKKRAQNADCAKRPAQKYERVSLVLGHASALFALQTKKLDLSIKL